MWDLPWRWWRTCPRRRRGYDVRAFDMVRVGLSFLSRDQESLPGREIMCSVMHIDEHDIKCYFHKVDVSNYIRSVKSAPIDADVDVLYLLKHPWNPTRVSIKPTHPPRPSMRPLLLPPSKPPLSSFLSRPRNLHRSKSPPPAAPPTQQIVITRYSPHS